MSRHLDIQHDKEGHVKINPSWLMQTGIVILLSVIAYFIDGSLEDIQRELEFSRIERAQLRADLTSFQIGTTGDRFTASMWREERKQLEEDLDDIRRRITDLEAK
jgi:hypothetical protein